MPFALAAASSPILTIGLLLVVWGLCIAFAYWDLNRQLLPRVERLAWLAAVVLLPGVGLLAYLLFRLFGQVFPLGVGGGPGGSARRRFTQLRQSPAGAPGRTGTILAADLVQETVADRQLLRSLTLKLEVIIGPHTGQEFALEALPVRLGRGGEAGVRLDRDLGVSRQHAEIYWQDGALRIRDLGSSHGLSVNGVPVHDQPLAPGDKIQLGLSTLVVKEANP